MPITTRKPAPTSLMYKFRSLMEGLVLEDAQEALLREYPGTGTSPARKIGFFYSLLRTFFVPIYRLFPGSFRQKIMQLLFVHREQHWPAQPWKTK